MSRNEMPEHDIIVIGASAGGIHALTNLIEKLPKNFPATIMIVQHLSPHRPSALPYILSRESELPVLIATNGVEIKAGHVYVAPPDEHLIVENSHLKLTRGPKENFSRP